MLLGNCTTKSFSLREEHDRKNKKCSNRHIEFD